jgi:5-formyltetrahydrofolate cyclo-ligase
METLNKKYVRQLILKKRLMLTLSDIALGSDKIVNQIREDINYQKSNIVGIYLPIKNEVDIRKLLNDDKTFCVPKIVNNEIFFTKIDDKTEYQVGKYNILEPINLEVIDEIDYLIVPAIAIYNNYRLGFGGGYYDRYLHKYRPKYVVGVIYQFQEIEFDVRSHDEKLDYFFKG